VQLLDREEIFGHDSEIDDWGRKSLECLLLKGLSDFYEL
jgi:hypothetical protein